MRIFICGSSCTGKTSIINELKKLDKFKDYLIVPSARGKLVNLGLSHTQNSNELTQEVYFNHYLEYYDKYNVIFDRSLIDVLGYSEWNLDEGNISVPFWVHQNYKFRQLEKRIDDLYFFIPPEFPLVDDGFRTITEEMRQDISNRIEKLLIFYKINYYVLSGNLKSRVRQIQSAIDKQH